MKKIIAASLLFAPAFAFAQTGPQLQNVQTLIQRVGQLVNLLIPIVVAIALLLFFWGLARFIMAAGDEGAKEQGRNLMIWGVIAFVVMLSIWGIVTFIQSALGIGGSYTIQIPQV
jgi:hypothetical protein